LQSPISITAIASISALGTSEDEVWQSYYTGRPLFIRKPFKTREVWISEVSSEAQESLLNLRRSSSNYKNLDRTVLLAILASKRALTKTKNLGKNVGVNIGSSRGATELFEKYHKQFLEGKGISAYTSPTTTLGNISSWVGQELGLEGVQIGHSVTCSTALHSLLNGMAWLNSNMADAFVVGGSEAALTPFTIAQMKALKLYSKSENTMACESMRFEKKRNTMVLGEAAAIAIIEKPLLNSSSAVIKGYGFATENLFHNSSISENAICFQKSMKMALKNAKLDMVDVIVMHAPGTVKGDLAEKNAIDLVFGKTLPLLTSNKWLVGHTFGASGMLSLEMAVLMLKHNHFIENPFFNNERHLPKEIKTIMINAVGFGGNAVSIIISNP